MPSPVQRTGEPRRVSPAASPAARFHPGPRLALVAALGVVLLAFFLRAYRLADQNIWWDEGWTTWLSKFNLAEIALRTARDEHPPLHYWLMHSWQRLAGAEAFAGRYFSLFFGVLSVAVLYRIGKRTGGAWLGVLAALLLALARFHIWWSQDIKNYTLSVLFGLISVWATLALVAGRKQATDRGLRSAVRGPSWPVYVLSSALALYSHYLAALIFLANNLFVAFKLLSLYWTAGRRAPAAESGLSTGDRAPRQPVRLLISWSLAQVATLALFAPWLALYLQNASTWSAAPAFDFGLFVRLAATVLPLGVTTYIERYLPVAFALGLVAALGASWIFRRERPPSISSPPSAVHRPRSSLRDGAGLALLIVLVPPVLIYLLSLTPAAFFAPKVQARYLLILAPAYLLLVALGVARLARVRVALGAVALVGVLAAQGWTLADYYGGRVLRDEYATLANTINAFAQPGDGVLLHTDQEWPTFLYYLRAPVPWQGVPNATPVDDRAARELATNLAARLDGVWLVVLPDALARDPGRLVEKELAARLPLRFERTIGDKKLALYARTVHNLKDVPAANFAPQRPLDQALADDLRLVGLDQPVREARGGDMLHVVTYWAAQAPAVIRLELRDSAGQVVRADAQTVSIGAHERIQSDLTLPPGAAGDFAVVARAKLGARTLASVRVTPRFSPVPAGAIPHPVEYGLGEDVRLVGHDLAPNLQLRPGETLHLTLYWKAVQPAAATAKAFVQLVGTQFNPNHVPANPLWGQADQVPGDLPLPAWEPGELVPDTYQVLLEPGAPPGRYQVLVGLYDPLSGARRRVTDASGREVGDAVVIGEIVVNPP